MSTHRERLLVVESLSTQFQTPRGTVKSVDELSFTLGAGETLGVVGESGCGKSVTALSILRLLPTPPAKHSGRVFYQGTDLLALEERAMRVIRGNRISMIFQDPMTSLNPVMTVGAQIAETLQLHQGLSSKNALSHAVEMLRMVRIPDPERRVHEYPHNLSGGMRQRVMIALALACRPEVLIADEPTTALDVTIQAQILELLKSLQAELGMGVLMITHDLGVVAESCDRVIVMYAGRKVEEAPVRELFASPLHPYTQALMASMPSLNASSSRLNEIPGMVPAPSELGQGCSFARRCTRAMKHCFDQTPPLVSYPLPNGDAHSVSCFAVATEGRSTPIAAEVLESA